MSNAATAYRKAFFESLRVPEQLTISEWADKYRILTKRSSPEPGPWRTSRVPHAKEPMDLLSPQERKIKRVILKWGAQGLGKSECGYNFIGASICMYPAPFIFLLPSEKFIKKQWGQRLEPLLKDTPAIAALRSNTSSRNAGNSMFLQLFKNDMMLSVAAGHSGSDTQGMPARYLWADEISSFPLDADGQGDPVANAEARTSNFGSRKKILLTSTPGVEGECRITKEYETKSDKRVREVQAPCCDAWHVLLWKDFAWDTPRGDVFWQCPSCGERISEDRKPRLLARAIWTPTAEGDGETAGFHLPGWYSPYGWLTWRQIRDEFLLAKDDRELLVAWVQKRAAEAYKEDTSIKFSTDDLLARRNDTSAGNGYASGVVPRGVVLVTIGADVQGGGGTAGECVHAHVLGWGAGEECWHLAHVVIDGDPTRNETLDQLDHLAGATWRREDGAELGASIGVIDQGGLASEEVRRWCAKRVGRWVCVQGRGSSDSAIINSGTFVSFRPNDKLASKRKDVKLYGVNYRRSIDLLNNRLKILQPGPGYIHLGAAATDQVVAELFPWRYRLVQKNGLVSHTWDLPGGQHDEAGDCWRYAYAGMELVRRWRFGAQPDQIWNQLEAAALATIGPATPPEPQTSRPGGGWLPDKRQGWLSR